MIDLRLTLHGPSNTSRYKDVAWPAAPRQGEVVQLDSSGDSGPGVAVVSEVSWLIEGNAIVRLDGAAMDVEEFERCTEGWSGTSSAATHSRVRPWRQVASKKCGVGNTHDPLASSPLC